MSTLQHPETTSATFLSTNFPIYFFSLSFCHFYFSLSLFFYFLLFQPRSSRFSHYVHRNGSTWQSYLAVLFPETEPNENSTTAETFSYIAIGINCVETSNAVKNSEKFQHHGTIVRRIIRSFFGTLTRYTYVYTIRVWPSLARSLVLLNVQALDPTDFNQLACMLICTKATIAILLRAVSSRLSN